MAGKEGRGGEMRGTWKAATWEEATWTCTNHDDLNLKSVSKTIASYRGYIKRLLTGTWVCKKINQCVNNK